MKITLLPSWGGAISVRFLKERGSSSQFQAKNKAWIQEKKLSLLCHIPGHLNWFEDLHLPDLGSHLLVLYPFTSLSSHLACLLIVPWLINFPQADLPPWLLLVPSVWRPVWLVSLHLSYQDALPKQGVLPLLQLLIILNRKTWRGWSGNCAHVDVK